MVLSDCWLQSVAEDWILRPKHVICESNKHSLHGAIPLWMVPMQSVIFYYILLKSVIRLISWPNNGLQSTIWKKNAFHRIIVILQGKHWTYSVWTCQADPTPEAQFSTVVKNAGFRNPCLASKLYALNKWFHLAQPWFPIWKWEWWQLLPLS